MEALIECSFTVYGARTGTLLHFDVVSSIEETRVTIIKNCHYVTHKAHCILDTALSYEISPSNAVLFIG